MPPFTVNTNRIDPLKAFKFRVVIDGQYVAAVSKVSGLKRTTEVVTHTDGGDPFKRHSPGRSTVDPVTLDRGVTYDDTFRAWANLVYDTGDGSVSLAQLRKDIAIELMREDGVPARRWILHRCWVSEFHALPELDANGNAVAIESIVLQLERFELDESVVETPET